MAQKTHSDLSPSSADRWLNCPGSVALCRTVPKLAQSANASEGECAHTLLEKCMKNQKNNPYDYIGDVFDGVTVTEEMAEAVAFARETLNNETQQGQQTFIEQKVIVIPGVVEGTPDFAGVREFDTLLIADFKYGKGVLVPAMDNPQLMLYAIPYLKRNEVAKVRIMIIQPRAENQVSIWDTTPEQIEAFAQEVERKIALTKEENALTASGDWCRWCAAKTVCPSLRKDLRESLPATVQNKEIVFPDAKSLTTEVVKKILDARSKFDTFFDAVEAYAFEFLESGGVIEGYELGKKRANRRWVDELEALQAFADLGDKAYSVKILTPAQMEKIAGKERVAKLTEVPDNGMTLKKQEKKK